MLYGLYFICSQSDCATSVSFIVSGKTRFIAMLGMKSESKILLPIFFYLYSQCYKRAWALNQFVIQIDQFTPQLTR